MKKFQDWFTIRMMSLLDHLDLLGNGFFKVNSYAPFWRDFVWKINPLHMDEIFDGKLTGFISTIFLMEIEQFSFWRDFFLLKINPFHFDEIFDGKFQFQFLPQVWILKTKVDLAYRWFYDAFEINLLSWPTV